MLLKYLCNSQIFHNFNKLYTFFNYKHHNTYKWLIHILLSGAFTFCPDLYSGSFSDKELTWKSELLKVLEADDSVKAGRAFDIRDDQKFLGVTLNIPPF